MNLEEAKLKLSKYGQEQILRYYDELSDDEKNALLEQVDKTDMEVLSAIEHKSELVKKGEITPLDAMELDEIKANYDTFKNTGVEAIKAGKVGAILLAGGMGTRLGSDDAMKFIGFENYQKLFSDKNFWLALKNTVYFTVIVVPCTGNFGRQLEMETDQRTDF